MNKTFTLFLLFLNSFQTFSQSQYKKDVGDSIILYEINFDSSTNYIHVDTSSQNLWKIGRQQKTVFDSSYSPSNAIITDTMGVYPSYNYSYFDLYVGYFNHSGYYGDCFIDFWHKYDTDTLRDGGYITVSWDNGLTWTNVINDTIYEGDEIPGSYFLGNPNLYTTSDTLFNGEFGFSGSSGGWVHSGLSWFTLAVKKKAIPDTMIIRFNFLSDSLDNSKEGWIIDNIRFFFVEMQGGITDNSYNNNLIKIYPNPSRLTTALQFDQSYKSINIAIFDQQTKFIQQHNYSNCNRIELNNNDLLGGLYFFKILIDGNIVVTKKVVLNN